MALTIAQRANLFQPTQVQTQPLAEMLAPGLSDAERTAQVIAQENAYRQQANTNAAKRAADMVAALKALGFNPVMDQQTTEASPGWLIPSTRQTLSLSEYPSYEYAVPYGAGTADFDPEERARYMLSNALWETYGAKAPSTRSLSGKSAAEIQQLISGLTPIAAKPATAVAGASPRVTPPARAAVAPGVEGAARVPPPSPQAAAPVVATPAATVGDGTRRQAAATPAVGAAGARTMDLAALLAGLNSMQPPSSYSLIRRNLAGA